MVAGTGKLKFQYLAEHDVLVVTVDWRIDTESDIELWYEAYARHFRKHFKRKVDLILDLTRFHLNPRIAGPFGEARAKLLREYTGRTYRVKADSVVKTAMYTSHVLHNAPANEFPSIEAALQQLLADRAHKRTPG
jgi:hypothetical protein